MIRQAGDKRQDENPTRMGASIKRESAPGMIRTCDQRFRKPLLYPLSYEGRLNPF
jgi:hypothetical protein